MKEPYSTKLGQAEAQWVERQAIVFGSYSLVIETCVRVVMALITRGTLRFELAELQELLQRNEVTHFVPAADAPGKALLRADRAERSAPGRANGSLRRMFVSGVVTLRASSALETRACEPKKVNRRLPVSKVAREACFITPFQYEGIVACWPQVGAA